MHRLRWMQPTVNSASTLNANANQQLADAEALSVRLQEVSPGINNTNEAITEQISQTHEIQEKVSHVAEALSILPKI